MIVLGLDTALSSCSLAILRGGETLFENFAALEKGHAEALPQMAAEAFKAADVAPAEVDRIGVVIGPGQFAGVRVGLAFARGLALGQKADVVGVNSLRALYASHAVDGIATGIVIDAHRGEVFAALYGAAGQELIAPFAAAPDAAAGRLRAGCEGAAPRLIGSGADLLPGSGFDRAATPSRGWAIDATAVARFVATVSPTDFPPTPLYLRAPDARPSAKPLFAGLVDDPTP